MGRGIDTGHTPSRRGVLSAIAGSAVIPGTSTVDSVVDDPAGETALGTFETGMDGWRGSTGVSLSRVGRDEWAPAVTEGERALRVAVEGATGPSIRRRVDAIDLDDAPSLLADATPGAVEGTRAPVVFQFRLTRRTSSDLDGDGVETLGRSDPVELRQAVPGRIFWDASDIDSNARAAATHLEVHWYPADAASDSGDDEPRFGYRGEVVLDDIRASESVETVGLARFLSALRNLEAEHGSYERTEVGDRGGTVETGRFVFVDGATEEYRFVVVSDDRYRLSLADTTARLGGGW